jgi:hypothetical protein
MVRDLWVRTKHVASTYTGTFIVVMLLNQLLFFGFCLNPICLIAAMPHVLFITVGVGSWINKLNNWGAGGGATQKASHIAAERQHAYSPENLSPGNLASGATLRNKSQNAFEKKVSAHSALTAAKSELFRERLFIDTNMRSASRELALQEKLRSDPALARQFEKVVSEWDGSRCDDASAEAEKPIIRNVAQPLPSDPSGGSKYGKEHQEKLEQLSSRHARHLKAVKIKLLRNPSLMKIFEEEMEESGGKNVFDHIMAIRMSAPRSIVSPGVSNPIGGTSRLSGKTKDTLFAPPKNLPMEKAHKFGETPLEFFEGKGFADLCFISDNYADIKTQAEVRKIPHLVHFTRCENLRSILNNGLISVADCVAKDICSIRNDSLRLDAQLDGISLSITFPNYRMFYKYRELDKTKDWAVLILSPEILWRKKCAFYRNNAADARMREQTRESMMATEAFQLMFEAKEARREHWLRAYDPTDPQAEVMVYEKIEAELIETIAFETKDIAKRWQPALRGIESISAGTGKGLFASRFQVRQI